MWTVAAALLPATAVGIAVFGLPALKVMIFSTLAAVLTELVIGLILRKPLTIADGSAVVTGLLVGMNMPPLLPWYIPVMASVFAIGVVKMLFGGLGYNFLNPALAGRVFVMFAWLPAMTTWQKPVPPEWVKALFVLPQTVDAVTWATPLNMLKLHGLDSLLSHFVSRAAMYKHLFVGTVGGSIGEVSAVALLIGALVLLARRIITPVIPFFYIGTVALFAWIFGGDKGLFTGDALFHVLSGGLLLGAFFMATDMVTSPITALGQAIFAIGAGLMTMIIRIWGGYPEGVSFSILFMNVLTPLIDKTFHSRFIFQLMMRARMKKKAA
jgi:electron transport complex protein RnfD